MHLDHAPSQRIESDSADAGNRSWIVPLENDLVTRQPYHTAMMDAVRDCFPDETFSLKRAYCNVVTFGDVLLPHRDSRNGRDVTALLFANDTWERAWGGETIFFNDGGDAVHAVSPRPGRMIAFRSIIEHRGVPPSRLCLGSRLTLVLKLRGADSE